MNYFPIFVDLHGKNALVIGGGEVAFNKITLLVRAKAKVSIIADKIGVEVQDLVQKKKISWISKKFHCVFLNEMFLVIAATNSRELNKIIFQSCQDRRILINTVDDQKKCSFIFPSIIDRSPIIIAMSSGGSAPVLLRLLREKIESILPFRLGKIAQIAGQWRLFVKQHFENFLDRRHFWERLFKSIFIQHVLNGKLDKAVAILKQSINKNIKKQGEIILVGAGPGDSGLLTLRGLQILQEADVVLYDFLISQDILELIRRDAKRICVGKRAGLKNITQNEIIALLISFARSGKKVVRLKGGDPFIFGRGGEELEAAKKAGINFQVVPGITAAIGISSYTGIPLTHRKYAQGVVFITGHKRSGGFVNNWLILCDPSYTIVVYMGTLKAIKISKKLILHGRLKSTPIAIVSQGTTLQQKVIIGRLDEVEQIVKYALRPSILIIGNVVLLHKQLTWFQSLSVFEKAKNTYSIIKFNHKTK